MAAPSYVPTSPTAKVRSYSGPGVVPDSWSADRSAAVDGPQPRGGMYGSQGPDQGYALKLAEALRPKLVLTEGESADDVLAGAVQIGLKRASLFTRGPVIHDLKIALNLWGFLGDAPAELVELRKHHFDGVANPHHWVHMRALSAMISDEVLRRTPAQIESEHRSNWRSLLGLA